MRLPKWILFSGSVVETRPEMVLRVRVLRPPYELEVWNTVPLVQTVVAWPGLVVFAMYRLIRI